MKGVLWPNVAGGFFIFNMFGVALQALAVLLHSLEKIISELKFELEKRCLCTAQLILNGFSVTLQALAALLHSLDKNNFSAQIWVMVSCIF